MLPACRFPTWLVLGEVVGVHIDRALLKDGVFDTFGAEIILRAGGPSAYAAIWTGSPVRYGAAEVSKKEAAF